MKRSRNLTVDNRRRAELFAQMRERARAWIPGWDGDDDTPDVARTLLEIAARDLDSKRAGAVVGAQGPGEEPKDSG